METTELEAKRYKVRAIIKYHEDIGTFEARTKEDAYKLAVESAMYSRIADRSRGGVWDLEIEVQP